MLVFLSHPMHGKSEDEIRLIRTEALGKLKERYGEDIRLIDNYRHRDIPEDSGRLWHLGRSIQQMEKADAIYFCGDWEKARGCRIEERIAREYALRVLE